MIKLLLFLVSCWHTMVWFPLMRKLAKNSWGRLIVHFIRLFFGSLVILHIISPSEGEIPCLIHLILRRKHSVYSYLRFRLRIRYLLKFWRS